MKMQSHVTCHAIKESKGSFEGKAFSSTTFHLAVDMAENTAGRSIGNVTRPFKLGDASEFETWANMKDAWPESGLPCVATFDVVAGADNSSKLTLLALVPAPVQQRKAA